jgi:hypothetical protein
MYDEDNALGQPAGGKGRECRQRIVEPVLGHIMICLGVAVSAYVFCSVSFSIIRMF